MSADEFDVSDAQATLITCVHAAKHASSMASRLRRLLQLCDLRLAQPASDQDAAKMNGAIAQLDERMQHTSQDIARAQGRLEASATAPGTMAAALRAMLQHAATRQPPTPSTASGTSSAAPTDAEAAAANTLHNFVQQVDTAWPTGAAQRAETRKLITRLAELEAQNGKAVDIGARHRLGAEYANRTHDLAARLLNT